MLTGGNCSGPAVAEVSSTETSPRVLGLGGSRGLENPTQECQRQLHADSLCSAGTASASAPRTQDSCLWPTTKALFLWPARWACGSCANSSWEPIAATFRGKPSRGAACKAATFCRRSACRSLLTLTGKTGGMLQASGIVFQ